MDRPPGYGFGMARMTRNIRAGVFYHVLNRSAGRITLFRREGVGELGGLLAKDAPRLPGDWLERVNAGVTRKELAKLRVSAARGRPYGSAQWVQRAAREMDLEHTLRREGRPAMVGN